MVQLIVGKKGKGKTKQLLDKVNTEVKEVSGNIVYLDKSAKHMYELNNKVRLIDVSEFCSCGIIDTMSPIFTWFGNEALNDVPWCCATFFIADNILDQFSPVIVSPTLISSTPGTVCPYPNVIAGRVTAPWLLSLYTDFAIENRSLALVAVIFWPTE